MGSADPEMPQERRAAYRALVHSVLHGSGQPLPISALRRTRTRTPTRPCDRCSRRSPSARPGSPTPTSTGPAPPVSAAISFRVGDRRRGGSVHPDVRGRVGGTRRGGRLRRPDVLNHGYKPATKLLFATIRLFSGRALPDAAKLVFYRPEFYGNATKRFTHLMRGPSAWSVGDRELMAAVVSQANENAFCVGAHTATAEQAYADPARVRAGLTDLETAPIEDGLRAVLQMLVALVRTGTVTPEDVRRVLVAGVTRQQVEDALAVATAFNVTNRLADAFGFEVLDVGGFAAGAKFLLKRGYQ